MWKRVKKGGETRGGATCTDWSNNRIHVREKMGFPAPPRGVPAPRRRRRTCLSMLSTARGGGDGSGRGAFEMSLLTFRSPRLLKFHRTVLWRSIKDAGFAMFKAQRALEEKAIAYGAKRVVLHTALRNPNLAPLLRFPLTHCRSPERSRTRCRARVQAVARRFWR